MDRKQYTSMPTTGEYKTFKVKRDPHLKEAKETMSKPVAVPLDQYVGLTFLASKDKSKLMTKLTSRASAAVESYADANTLEASD